MVTEKSRGMALVTVVIALLIVGVSTYLMVKFYTAGKHKETSYTSPIDRARDIQCRSQVRRVETAIQVYRLEKGENPRDLRELSLREKDWYCPVTDNPYKYSSDSGTVVCPDHGR